MPYIKDVAKQKMKAGYVPGDPGTLNYTITKIIWDYYRFTKDGERPGYQQVNDVLGALEGAKLEFYRRVAAPYEDKKIEENGDVYV